MINHEETKRIGHETAQKYIDFAASHLPEQAKEMIRATFYAGWASGIKYIVTGDERTPPERANPN